MVPAVVLTTFVIVEPLGVDPQAAGAVQTGLPVVVVTVVGLPVAVRLPFVQR